MWGDVARCGEIWGDVGRCGEMWGDVARCGEMWRDVGRCGEMWRDVQLDLTELSSYLPSVSCFGFGNAFSILFPCTGAFDSALTPRRDPFH